MPLIKTKNFWKIIVGGAAPIPHIFNSNQLNKIENCLDVLKSYYFARLSI